MSILSIDTVIGDSSIQHQFSLSVVSTPPVPILIEKTKKTENKEEQQDQQKKTKKEDSLDKVIKTEEKSDSKEASTEENLVLDLIKALPETTGYSQLLRFAGKNAPTSLSYSSESTYGFAHSFFSSDYETYSLAVSEEVNPMHFEPKSEDAMLSRKELEHYIDRFAIGMMQGSSYTNISVTMRKKVEYFTMFTFNAPVIMLKMIMSGFGVGYELPPTEMTSSITAAETATESMTETITASAAETKYEPLPIAASEPISSTV